MLLRAYAALLTTSVTAAAGLALPSAAQAAAPAPAGIRLVTHAPVRAGDPATVDVYADGVSGLAGYELVATAGASRGGAPLAGADSRTGPAGFRDLSMSDLDTRAVLAAYSATGRTVSGTVRLGTLYLDDLPAGPTGLRVSAVRLVGSDGRAQRVNPVAAATVTPADTRGPVHPAAAAGWTLPAATGKVTARTVDRDLPLTWENLRLAGGPCSPAGVAADRNGDGCLDVGDLLLNARVSATTLLAPRASIAGVTSFVVNSTSDNADITVGDGVCKAAGGSCTLRAAIQEANAEAGPQTIGFAIPGSGVQTIQLLSRLPALNDPSGGTVIDGYTQPGAAVNTAPLTDNAQLTVEIRGNGAAGDGAKSGFDALTVTSAGNTVRGLAIYNARRAIWMYGTGAHDNTVVGNFIGTDAAATFVSPTVELEGMGIKIEQDAAANTIGSSDRANPPTLADRNVVSGNARQGIALWHNNTDRTLIVNNIVGLSPDGTRAVPNRKHGIDLNFGVSQTQVGGLRTNERNVSSGNDDDGIEVSHTSLTTDNDVVGNYVGTDVTGNAAFPYTANQDVGIYLEDAVTANRISRNVIGNNARGGIVTINGGQNGITTGNVFTDNRIGVGTGGAALGNGLFGISANGSGNTFGPGNLIANNAGPGIQVDDVTSVDNTFTQNGFSGNAGLAIDLSPIGQTNPNDPGDADTGANDGLNYPEPLTTTPTSVNGTACSGCRVEVYTAGSYVGTATADATGGFSLPISLPAGTRVSAIAISPAGDTSEFAPDVTVVAANRPPVIDAGPDITVDPNSTWTLTASVSDPDGTPGTVSWDLDGNGSFERTGNPVAYTAPATGPATVTVTARVTDPGGLTATDTLTVTVRPSVSGAGQPAARMVVPDELTAGEPIPISMDQPDRAGLLYAYDCSSGFGASTGATTATCPAAATPAATVRAKVTDPASGLSTTYAARIVVHQNLLTNGDLETASGSQPAGWSWGSGRTYATAPVHSGSRSVASNATGTSTAVLAQSYTGGLDASQYAVSAWVNVPATGTGSVTLRLRWYDAAGVNVATRTIGTVSDPTSGWRQIREVLTPRAGAVRETVEIAWNTSNRPIAVDDIVLSRANEVLNPEFEIDTAPADGRPDSWAQIGRLTTTSAVAHLGSYAGRAAGDGGAFTVAQRVKTVQPGATYQVSGWINVPANTDTFTLRVQLRWQDASSSGTLRLDPISSRYGTPANPYDTPGWQPFSATVTAPAGAAFGNLEFAFSAGFHGVAYLDSVVLARS